MLKASLGGGPPKPPFGGPPPECGRPAGGRGRPAGRPEGTEHPNHLHRCGRHGCYNQPLGSRAGPLVRAPDHRRKDTSRPGFARLRWSAHRSRHVGAGRGWKPPFPVPRPAPPSRERRSYAINLTPKVRSGLIAVGLPALAVRGVPVCCCGKAAKSAPGCLPAARFQVSPSGESVWPLPPAAVTGCNLGVRRAHGDVRLIMKDLAEATGPATDVRTATMRQAVS